MGQVQENNDVLDGEDEDGNKNHGVNVLDVVSKMCEESKKKNNKLQNKLNSQRIATQKIKMFYIILSLLLNLYFIIKCNC